MTENLTLYLVRWMDEMTAETLRDDGIVNWSLDEFIIVCGVFVTNSVEKAKELVIDCLINEELLDSYVDGEFVAPPRSEFSWYNEGDGTYCIWKGHSVAYAKINPIEVVR